MNILTTNSDISTEHNNCQFIRVRDILNLFPCHTFAFVWDSTDPVSSHILILNCDTDGNYPISTLSEVFLNSIVEDIAANLSDHNRINADLLIEIRDGYDKFWEHTDESLEEDAKEASISDTAITESYIGD